MVRYYRRRRIFKRSSRPTERIVRAGSTGQISTGNQVSAYVYTATDPNTATRFKLDTGFSASTAGGPVVYALVYVPEGYNINNIVYPAVTDDIYNPTKNVLLSGVLTDNAIEDHKSTSYSRKMAVGDRIALIYYNASSSQVDASFELSFTTVH